MQIGSRFTEYGLTGGFFWICQLLFLVYSGQAKTLLSNLSSVKLDPTSWISQIGPTAISALAIIAVFVTGLLLDLFAVYFRPMEMRVFRQHLVRNRDWLGRLITDHTKTTVKPTTKSSSVGFARLRGQRTRWPDSMYSSSYSPSGIKSDDSDSSLL